MIANPLADSLFLRTALSFGGILALAFPALLVAERGRLWRLRASSLFERWVTWLVLAPVFALAVLAGDIPSLALVIVCTIQAVREYARLVGLPRTHEIAIIVAGLIVQPLVLVDSIYFYAVPAVLLLVATLQPLLSQDVTAGTRSLAYGLFGFTYIPLFLGHLLMIRVYLDDGKGLLLALGLGVALSDVGAFVFGKAFGRRKLAAVLSPNKTWAGAGGNIVGAYAGIAIMWFALPSVMEPWLKATLPLVVAVGALWGDLVESLLKREFETRDAGDWLPGFGGLLDRIDSLLIVLPLVFFYVWFFTEKL